MRVIGLVLIVAGILLAVAAIRNRHDLLIRAVQSG
jgi:uncharacterized membrane protein HdeD (DUF308 family)